MTTPNFSITELAASQAQKHVTVNEAFRVVDTALNLTAISASETTPPGASSEGDKYIPAATATGAWTGRENDIAAFINSEWIFFTPAEGWRCYNQATDTLLLFDGTSWSALVTSGDGGGGGGGGLADDGSAAAPSYSFTSDTDTGLYRNAANELGFSAGGSERFKVASNQVTATTAQFLLTDAGSDADFAISKQATDDDAVLTFQTNFSTRAMLGLLGDDNFVIRVSADGSTFTDAITINASDGVVTLVGGDDGGGGGGSGTFLADDGSAAAPSYSFASYPDTGIYLTDENLHSDIVFATQGTDRLALRDGRVSVLSNILGVEGVGGASLELCRAASNSFASLTFITGDNVRAIVGLGRNSENIAFSVRPLPVGNVNQPFIEAFSVDTESGQVLFDLGVRTHDGSAVTPAYSFSNDIDMGMYRDATTEEIGFSILSLNILRLGLNEHTSNTGRFVFEHDTRDSTLVVNKNANENNAVIELQVGSTTEARIGLLGNEDFTIQVGDTDTTAQVIRNDASATDIFTPELNLTEANGGSLRFRVIEEELTNLSGSTARTTAAFPNQCIILGVSLRVTEAITGATSFDCGDGSEANRFGGSLGIAEGSTNQGTVGPVGNYSPTTVTLTANGGNFVRGSVRVCLTYLELIAPTS